MKLQLPPNVIHAPEDTSLVEMMAKGEISAGFSGNAGLGRAGKPTAGWDAKKIPPADYPDLFPDAKSLEAAWFKKTGIYPMHGTIVVKDSVLREHPWVARSLYDAYSRAKDEWLGALRAGSADAASDKKYRELTTIVGEDPLPFGIDRNRATIEALGKLRLQTETDPATNADRRDLGRPLQSVRNLRMPGPIVDIHPHIVSPDTNRYPLTPLFGIQSDWSKERTATDKDLIAAMDEAGVAKTAIVHASTAMVLTTHSWPTRSHIFPSVAPPSVRSTCWRPMLRRVARHWISRGLTGFRIFTGGSTKAVDASALDDARSYPVWELCSERGFPICIQTNASGLPATTALAKRFPMVPIIVDHFARPDVSGGPPYAAAAPLLALAALPNIYLKLTPVTLELLRKAKADVQTFIAKVAAEFGATRIAWGSNWPNSPGTLKEHVAAAKAALASLSAADQDAILGGTALRLYPSLNSR